MDVKDTSNPSGPVTLANGKTAAVDRNLCIGCGACAGTAPDAFAVDEEGKSCILASADSVSPEALESAKNSCPTGAISVK